MPTTPDTQATPHPTLQAFCKAYGARWPDLKLYFKADVLMAEYDAPDGCGFIVRGVMGESEGEGEPEPAFSWASGEPMRSEDHLSALVQAFAEAVSDIEDEGMSQPPAEPGSFGALVWACAINNRLAVLEATATDLRAALARLDAGPRAAAGLIDDEPTEDDGLEDHDEPDPPGGWDPSEPGGWE